MKDTMKVRNISLLIILVFSSSNAIASVLQKSDSVNKMPVLANSSSGLSLVKSADEKSLAHASNAKAEQDKKKKEVDADLKKIANDTLPLLACKLDVPCVKPRSFDEKKKLEEESNNKKVQSLPIIGNPQAALPKVTPPVANNEADKKILGMLSLKAFAQTTAYCLEARSPDNLYVILRERDLHKVYMYDGVDMSKKRTRKKITYYRAYKSIFTPDSKWLITQTDKRPGEIRLCALHQDKVMPILAVKGYSFEISPKSTHVAVLGKASVDLVRLDAQNRKVAFSRTYPLDAYEISFENNNLLITTADDKQYVIDCATV